MYIFRILAKVHKKKKLITPGVFFFSILWGRQSSNHPQKDLAKFGYKLERKVEKFRKSCYILANTYYILNLKLIYLLMLKLP
jgi:hypothetical protein